jgi:ABC-type Na+ efflux pump permease subunit
MTFLPILERELRVAARRQATYWARGAVALAALVIFALLIASARRSLPPGQLAQHVFNAVGVLGFAFCLLTGIFFTADCISEEKRERTLGLLFLTDLKGYDVIFGKLAATSLNAIYGLLAVLPVLGLPLLMGGVSGSQFGCLVLVLIATLFLSLTAGLCVSTLSRDTHQAMVGTLVLLLVTAGGFPLFYWLGAILLGAKYEFWLLLSPGYAFALALKGGGQPAFWYSLGLFLALAAGFLVLASLRLPRAWPEQETRPARVRTRSIRKQVREMSLGVRVHRSQILQDNPFHWLATRDLSQSPVGQWIGGLLLLLLAGSVWGTWRGPDKDEAFGCALFITYGLHQLFKFAVATEASRRFCEDRRSGALELLLTTPLSTRSILDGQWEALKARFRAPLFTLGLLNLALIWLLLGPNPMRMARQEKAVFSGILVGGILLLLLDFAALIWVGMRAGLRAQRHHRAVLGTFGRVMLCSWLAAFSFVFLGMSGVGDFETTLVLWFVIGAVIDIALIGWATNELLTRLRTLAGSYEIATCASANEAFPTPGLAPAGLTADPKR